MKDLKRGRKTKGITLIALVITIILIIILAAVSFNSLFSEKGIISTIGKAEEQHRIEEIREGLEVEKTVVAVDNRKGTVPLEEYLAHIIKERIITEENIIYQEEGYAEIQIEDYVYSLIQEESGNLKIVYLGKPEDLPPKIKDVVVAKGSNSLEVYVDAYRNDEGNYKYYIKDDPNGEYVEKETSTNNKYKFTGLMQEKLYYIKVEAINKKNLKAEKEIQESTQRVQVAEGNITVQDFIWNASTHLAAVTLAKDESISEDYLIQYQVNGTGENSWNTSAIAENLNLGDEVYYRLWDGNNGGEHYSTIVNDEAIPQAATINFSKTSTFVNSTITATITQTDNESGVDITKCKYVYNTIPGEMGIDESNYTGTFETNPQTIDLTGTQIDSYYLHILTVDYNGNKKETISQAIPVKDQKVINNLNVGDSIYYDPGVRTYTSPSSKNGMSNQSFSSASYKGTWKVLTKTSTAVTIISTKAVTNFQAKGQTGYTNFVSELNNISKIFVHPSYASSSRTVGYGNYTQDINNMKIAGTLDIGVTYWLGATLVETDSNKRTFYNARTIVAGGVQQNSWMYYRSSSGNIYTDTPSFRVRPVVTLKPDAPLESGTGTSSDIYYLK